MEILFIICAIFGGTVLVAQFLLGFAGHGVGGGEFDDDSDAPAGDHFESADDHHAHGDQTHHGSTWVFGILTFRTVMIGITFFGLTGKAALASGFEQLAALTIAVGFGLASMYGVYFLMRSLYRLTADGTERIGRSIGEEATVYLSVPANDSGVGKVHLTLQNRLVEYEAITSGERIATGTRVIVVGVSGSDRVVVEPIAERAGQCHA